MAEDKVRLSQVVGVFGPGAMLDLPERSVLIQGLDHWETIGALFAFERNLKLVVSSIVNERNIYRVSAVLGLAEAVEAGIGIGHLPCFVADARPNLIRLASPEPELAADLWLLTHRDLRQSARVRALLDFLAAEIAKKKSFIEGAKPVSRRTSSSPRA